MDILIIFVPLAIYIFSSRILEGIWKKNRKAIVNKNYDLLVILIASVLCISLNLLINSLLPFISDWFVNESNSTDGNLLVNSILAIISIIVAPVLEEVFFRYYLYNKIKIKTNIVLATIITSIIFGIIHFYSVVALLSTICLGIILQLVYNKTSNLMDTIVIHSICNLVITIVSIIVIPINCITLSILIILFLLSFLMFFIKIKRKSLSFR